MAGKRGRNQPWKRLYGKDRAYTARVDRARERGQYTPSRSELAAENKPLRAWYARLAAEYRKQPPVPDRGGGLSGDLYPL